MDVKLGSIVLVGHTTILILNKIITLFSRKNRIFRLSVVCQWLVDPLYSHTL